MAWCANGDQWHQRINISAGETIGIINGVAIGVIWRNNGISESVEMAKRKALKRFAGSSVSCGGGNGGNMKWRNNNGEMAYQHVINQWRQRNVSNINGVAEGG